MTNRRVAAAPIVTASMFGAIFVLASCSTTPPPSAELTLDTARAAAQAAIDGYAQAEGDWEAYCDASALNPPKCRLDAEATYAESGMVNVSTVSFDVEPYTDDEVLLIYSGRFESGGEFNSETTALIHNGEVRLREAIFWTPRHFVRPGEPQTTPIPTPTS